MQAGGNGDDPSWWNDSPWCWVRRGIATLVVLGMLVVVALSYIPGSGIASCRQQLLSDGRAVSVCGPIGTADSVLLGLLLLLAGAFVWPDLSEFGVAGLVTVKRRLQASLSVGSHSREVSLTPESEERRSFRRPRPLILRLAALAAAGALILGAMPGAVFAAGTFNISGIVSGSDGDLLANIFVYATSADGNFGGVHTASFGIYSFSVPSGSFMVYFEDASTTYRGGCFNSDSSGQLSLNHQTCTAVVVEASDVGGINVTLPLAPHFGGTISGIVSGSDGDLLANIFVYATSADGNFGGVHTASGGSYSFSVPSGSFIVHFNDASTTYRGGCYNSGFSGHLALDHLTCTAVVVQASDVGGINVTLPLAGPTGTAPPGPGPTTTATPIPGPTATTAATPSPWHITGTVSGSDGKSLGGIAVYAKNASDNILVDLVHSASDGSFWLSVPAGSFTVTFDDLTTAYVGGCYNSGMSGDRAPDHTTCTTVSVGTADVGPIDVTMAYTGPHHLSGTVSLSAGGESTSIFAYAEKADGTFVNGFHAESDGSFSFYVPSGDFTVFFHDDNWVYAYGCYNSDASGHFSTDTRACASVDVGATDLSGIDVTMPLAGPTPAGSNVIVGAAISGTSATGVQVTFAQVSAPGKTSAVASSAGPPLPGDFALAASPTYYDITTSATVSGPITVCLHYDPTAYADPSQVRLLHWNGASWDDFTSSLDARTATVCGTTTSLSPFVVAQRRAPAATPTAGPGGAASGSSPGGPGVGLVLVGLVLVVLLLGLAAVWWWHRRKKIARPNQPGAGETHSAESQVE